MKKNLLFVLFGIFSVLFIACLGDDEDNDDNTQTTTSYTIGGTVSGLSGKLILLNNSGDELTVKQDGTFTFETSLATEKFYGVTISSEPLLQVCDVANGAGIVGTSNVTNISVTCSTSTASRREFSDEDEEFISQCSICHGDYYARWAESGHGYKMNKVDGTIPTFPFSDVSAMFPDAGLDISYTLADADGGGSVTTHVDVNSVSYIIGGYGWKGRYFDSNGYLLYGSNAQYNFDDGSFGSYNNKKSGVKDGKSEYKCGFCHTTGWKGQSGNNENYTDVASKDNLAGLKGTWSFSGVSCQRCHGTLTGGVDLSGGEAHNTKSTAANIYDPGNFTTGEGGQAFGALTGAANNVCADCHLRGDYVNKVDVDTGKLLIKHHEQSQELYVGRHGNTSSDTTEGNGSISCVTCHDPHSSVRYDSLAKGEGVRKGKIANGNCAVTCHNANSAKSDVDDVKNSKVITVSATYSENHTCVTCHMPYIVSSAIAITASGNGVTVLATNVPGVTALGIPSTGNKRGDMRSHIFSLTADSNSSFMTSSTSTLDGTSAEVKIPVDFSCMTCHGTGGTSGPTTAAEAATQLSSTPVH